MVLVPDGCLLLCGLSGVGRHFWDAEWLPLPVRLTTSVVLDGTLEELQMTWLLVYFLKC